MANRAFLTRRRNKKELSFEGNNREDIVIPNLKKGFVHSLAKFILAWRKLKDGQHIISDPIYHNGMKSDLLALDEGITYNIIYSDTAEKHLSKGNFDAYPFVVQQISARGIIEDGTKSLLPSSWSVQTKKKAKK